ncbi:Uncharacterised protein [Salmonella enterica subsp. enterica serovar Typhimurium str. DT104]|nr:Uncharacterised protein [Salmonella enterica subsp. enterica serovar Typhimurium str. DT104]
MAMLQRCQRQIIGVINMVNEDLFHRDLAKRGQIPPLIVQVKIKGIDDQPDITAIDRIYDLHRHGKTAHTASCGTDRLKGQPHPAFFRHCRHLAQTLH